MDPRLAISLNKLKSLANTQAKVFPFATLLARTYPKLYPIIVCIYDLVSAVCPIALFNHQNPVLDFTWNPKSNKIAIVCKSGYWTISGNRNLNSSSFNSHGFLYFWEKSSSMKKSSSLSKAWIHNTTSTNLCFTGV